MKKNDIIPLFILALTILVSVVGMIKSKDSVYILNTELSLPQGFTAVKP